MTPNRDGVATDLFQDSGLQYPLPEGIAGWPETSVWQKVLLAFSVVTLVIGLILALLVIKPRVNNKSKDGLIFWGNIRAFEHYPGYQDAFFKTSPLGDVLKHNYYLAEVADQKYKMLQRAMFWQCGALPGFWLAILLTRFL